MTFSAGAHLIDDLPESDPPAYRRSLADLDIALAHPGHGLTFDGRRLRELARGGPADTRS
ncbi:hypothetical protein [Streptomyces sp. NPDC052107]|uniref:hypothetical protein n=1 Tax=Streptomyces sp. NPDC052107 TaxID=3155632 RepID=UPI0034476704